MPLIIRRILCIASLAPLVMFAVTMAQMVGTFAEVASSGSARPATLAEAMSAVLASQAVGMLVLALLMVACLIDVMGRRSAGGTENTVVWILVLLLAAPVAVPAYCWLKLWPRQPAADDAAYASTGRSTA